MLNKLIKSENSFIYITFSLMFCVYFSFFFKEAFMLDKNEIIGALTSINSLTDYIDSFHKFKIFDIQPIRDLSHKFDLVIIELTGFENFPLLINLLILLCTSLNLNKIFQNWFSKDLSLFLSCLFLVHPGIFFIFIEYTSRKHILSFLLFLLSFKHYLLGFHSSSKHRSRATLYYFLSCFTQPINLFTPLIFMFNDFLIKKEKLRLIKNYFFILGVTFFTGSINLYYFKVIYFEINGITRTQSQLNPAQFTSIFGIFIRQFFAPVSYSMFYTLYTLSAVISLITFPIIWLLSFKKNKEITYIGSFLIFLSLFILYGQGTHIIYLNTYLLTPFLGFSFILGNIINSKFKNYFFIFLIIPFISSIYYSTKRTNEISFYKYALEHEPNCRGIQYITLEAIRNGNNNEMEKYGKIWLDRKCRVTPKSMPYIIDYIQTFLILNSQDFSIDEKLSLFNKRLNYENDFIYFKAFLYRKTKPQKSLMELDKLKIKSDLSIFMDLKSHLTRDLLNFCKEYKNKNGCSKFERHIEFNKGKDLIFKLKSGK